MPLQVLVLTEADLSDIPALVERMRLNPPLLRMESSPGTLRSSVRVLLCDPSRAQEVAAAQNRVQRALAAQRALVSLPL